MTIEQFAAMKETERRLLVRRLSDEEYLDLLAVCATFPHVDVCAETQGEGEEVPQDLVARLIMVSPPPPLFSSPVVLSSSLHLSSSQLWMTTTTIVSPLEHWSLLLSRSRERV